MEAVTVALGVVLGWGLAHVSLALRTLRGRRREISAGRHSLYARLLAASDTCYRLIDFIATWPRRAGTGETPRPRTPSRAAAIINEASLELETNVRRMRELIAEVRLMGAMEVLAAAKDLHESLEEAILAVRLETPAQLSKRWESVAPRWRSSRDAFVEAARNELGS